MLNRLRWIAVSYYTRPLVWACCVLAGLFFIISWLAAGHPAQLQPAYPSPPFKYALTSQSDFKRLRAAGRLDRVEMVYLRQWWIDRWLHDTGLTPEQSRQVTIKTPTTEFYRLLDEFPRLKGVEYGCFDT